ncbi:MAG: DUF2142 domain-containing protein [Chloroflexi bacterium]|nr:DUF2142 domain-containing protein [Chloroflexota bacterium]
MHRALLFILFIYLLLGGLYAALTPAWQTPDEPAHFNYARELAEKARLPLLRPGDYDQAYLETIKAAGFPAHMSIDNIRYEGHQPPLYYALASPILMATQGTDVRIRLFWLRLLGVALGAGVVLLIWAIARRLFPQHIWRAAWAAAFAAFLPMHIAMMASANNDGLSELLIAAVIFRLLGHLKSDSNATRGWPLTGALLGLALLTKFQTYMLAPLVLGVWLWQGWREQGKKTWRFAWLRAGAAWMLPAFLLPLPWWLRNMQVYGFTDPLGLKRHDAVVTGQPRTLDWIAQTGWNAYLDRLVDFSFQSFWGVFGWLGAFMDGRVYLLLAFLSLFVVVGLAWRIWRWSRGPERLSAYQRRGLRLLFAQFLLVLAAYGWYNLSFVQHQGRYFFPALAAIALGFALGLEGMWSREGARWAAGAALIAAAYLLAAVRIAADINGLALFVAVASALFFAAYSRFWPFSPRPAALATLALMPLLSLYALFVVVP